MKKFITLICLLYLCRALPICAQYTSDHYSYPSEFVQDVIVRNYNNVDEIVFGYNEDFSVVHINPPFPGECRTTIYRRSMSNNVLAKMAVLPNAYRVYDVQFITIEDTTGKPTDLCVFCGTRRLYDDILPPTRNFDSIGFVGFFYLDCSIVGAFTDSVYLRDVEGAKHLTKLIAYTEQNPYYITNGTCTSRYITNVVLDVIGLPKNNVNRSSCFARVKFYPDCSGGIRWDNNIRTPSVNSTEKLVDITGTVDSIITVSAFNGDSNTIWLRHNRKESYFYYGGMQLSNKIYPFYLNTISVNGTTLPNPQTTYFQKPLRICAFSMESGILSFIAKNGTTSQNLGLFSYVLRLGNTPNAIMGAQNTAATMLIDVSRYTSPWASVSLTLNASSQYYIPTIEWGTNPLSNNFPLFALTYTVGSLKSIDTYIGAYGVNQFLHIGSSEVNSNDELSLLRHKYFNALQYPDCFYTNVVNIPNASIECTAIYGYNYGIWNRYPHNPIAYPVTSILINQVPVTNITICSE
ncbi:MAG: hypothetical protein IJU81_01420 [Bacteroidales bacterium]|nr:hypothetical protein [Bacteroidales bacterium]